MILPHFVYEFNLWIAKNLSCVKVADWMTTQEY